MIFQKSSEKIQNQITGSNLKKHSKIRNPDLD